MSETITITAPARIHITLVSMTDRLYRRNGGVGFAINGFDICIEASISKKVKIKLGTLVNSIDKRTITATIKLLNEVIAKYTLKNSVEILVRNFPPQHSGFGSGTSLKLACLESLFLLNHIKISNEELSVLSGRGGTSGIGINAYFNGGFIFDVGRKSGSLLPSNSCSRFELPMLFNRIEMPEWEFGVYKSSNTTPLNLEQEKAFFDKICPIDNASIFKLTYEIVFKLIPSIMDRNVNDFSESIREIQAHTWKNMEWRAYGNYYEQTYSILNNDSLCFGLSSLGTGCYFLPTDKEKIHQKIIELDPNALIEYVTINNSGRTVAHV